MNTLKTGSGNFRPIGRGMPLPYNLSVFYDFKLEGK